MRRFTAEGTDARSTSRLDLNPTLGAPVLRMMNFLNEVVLDFPNAISFGPGRPADAFVDIGDPGGALDRYVTYRASQTGATAAKVRASLGQYGRTNGIIGDLVARLLETDEGISVDASDVMITAGAQEGMNILLQGLFDPRRDVLLVTDPNYVGMTGAAQVLGVRVEPVEVGEHGVEVSAVVAAMERVRAAGLRPKALYDIPDFHNPQATTLSLENRRALLELAVAHDLLVIEDNPYGMFAYDGERLPTLKSLDAHRSVIYLGTFAKTLMPGLRIGYVVADQRIFPPDDGKECNLASELSKVKSLVTVNTSPILQAIVGGMLLEQGVSLRGANEGRIAHYRANRDRLLLALERRVGPGTSLEGRVRWRRPAGGFFLPVETPFAWTDADVITCAREFGVIVCPMSSFSMQRGHERRIRLSFSNVTFDQIDEGVDRLARFIEARV